jgi:hypothetical protein
MPRPHPTPTPTPAPDGPVRTPATPRKPRDPVTGLLDEYADDGGERESNASLNEQMYPEAAIRARLSPEALRRRVGKSANPAA